MVSPTLNYNDFSTQSSFGLHENIWLPIKIWLYKIYVGRFLLTQTAIGLAKHQETFTKRLEDSILVVQESTPEIAAKKLDGVNGYIKQYIDIIDQIEEVSFFGNKRLEKAVSTNLRLMYKTESILRKIAFSNTSKEKRVNYEFMDELTKHSFNSLPTV